MRGHPDKQTRMWTSVTIECRVPQGHPIRRIKRLADQELLMLSRRFNQIYSKVGRPSIPPERILKAQLLRTQ